MKCFTAFSRNCHHKYRVVISWNRLFGPNSRSRRPHILMATEILESFDLKMYFTYNRVMELLLENIC